MTVLVKTEDFTIETFGFEQKRCSCGELLPRENCSGRCKKCHAKWLGKQNKK